MPLRFAANLGFLWPQLPLLDRIDAAARAGFRACEFHWPYAVPATELAARCRQANIRILGINTPRGDVSKGEFGLAALPGREVEFRGHVEKALEYALSCGGSAIHVLAGMSANTEASRSTFIENLRFASSLALKHELTLLLEPLNPHDNPGYFYSRVSEAMELLDELALPNLKLQFDAYHVARVGDDVFEQLRACHAYLGNVQIAGVPRRGEPDDSELNYREFFAELQRLNYSGYIGCEYRPHVDTDIGLAWMKNLNVSIKDE
jgi:hydroxypyruvate isomerase